MKKLSVAVMAHPSREKFFSYLKENLGDIPFSIDYENKGPWENAKKAWAMFDPNAEYHTVIQDDAIICKDFYNKAEKVLKYPNLAYSFYYGYRGNTKRVFEKGLKDGGILKNGLSWGVAICLPTKLIPEMIEWCDKSLRIKNDDTRISYFLKWKGIKVYYPIPSLVDHRTGEISLVGDAGKGRRAWLFIDNANK
jgi:hypothetical protein